MKSKERIRPINPKDVSNLIREAEATSQFEPGTLVRRSAGSNNDLIEKVDTTALGSNTDDVEAAAEVVWTDMTTRFDAQSRPEYDKDASPGSRVNSFYKATTVPLDFLADVETANVFDSGSSPSAGDLVIKSRNTAGLLESVADAETLVAGDADVSAEMVPGLKVGVVHGSGQISGFVRVQFDLG